jgi:hypothetical protein
MADDEADEPADRMRARGPGSRVKLWVLLSANRSVVTACLLALMFGSLVVLGTVAPVSLRTAASQSDPIETLFQALVTAIITGVTLVVTITQLVLAQELGPAGDQRERMEGAMTFRDDVADHLEAAVSPPEPAAFLGALVEATARRARAVRDAVGSGHDQSLQNRVETFADELTANATAVRDRLDGAEFGTFAVVSAALDYNYSRKIYEARRLQATHEDELSAEATQALEDLLATLQLFGPAREHIKTLYFQWELANLSRAILYAAVPALVVGVAGVLWLEPSGAVTGATLGVDNLLLVVSAATTVAVAPFFLLIAYILRIVTVTKRTLAIGPFVLRETGDEE